MLVCTEKHGSCYFVVDSDEELFRAALSILRGRLKLGHFYHDPGPSPDSKLDFTADDVAGMPESLRASAIKRLQEHKQNVLEWKRESEMLGDINLACSSADGRLAWEVLRDRSDWEYENVVLEEVRTEYPGG